MIRTYGGEQWTGLKKHEPRNAVRDEIRGVRSPTTRKGNHWLASGVESDAIIGEVNNDALRFGSRRQETDLTNLRNDRHDLLKLLIQLTLTAKYRWKPSQPIRNLRRQFPWRLQQFPGKRKGRMSTVRYQPARRNCLRVLGKPRNKERRQGCIHPGLVR